MTIYTVAQITIHDAMRYKFYVDRFLPTLRNYKGRLLAADEAPEAIEGRCEFDKLILLSFPSRDAFNAWRNSEEYKLIAIDRLAATTGDIVLVRSLPAKNPDTVDEVTCA